MTTALQLQPRATSARCVLCHDALGAEAVTCPDCGTLVHEECQLDRCPTLGCESEEPWTWIRLRDEGWERLNAWRQPLLLLNAVLAGLIVAGVAGEWAISAWVSHGSHPTRSFFFAPDAHPSLLDPAPPCYCGEHARPAGFRYGSISRACGGHSREGRRFSYRSSAHELRRELPGCGCRVQRVWALRAGRREEVYEAYGDDAVRSSWSGDVWVEELGTASTPRRCRVSYTSQGAEPDRIETPAGVFECTYEHTWSGYGADRVDMETWTAAGIPRPVVTQVTWRTPGAPGGFPNVRRDVLVRIDPPPSAR